MFTYFITKDWTGLVSFARSGQKETARGKQTNLCRDFANWWLLRCWSSHSRLSNLLSLGFRKNYSVLWYCSDILCFKIQRPIFKCLMLNSEQVTYADTHPMFTARSFPHFFRVTMMLVVMINHDYHNQWWWWWWWWWWYNSIAQVVPSENQFNQPRLSLLKSVMADDDSIVLISNFPKTAL